MRREKTGDGGQEGKSEKGKGQVCAWSAYKETGFGCQGDICFNRRLNSSYTFLLWPT